MKTGLVVGLALLVAFTAGWIVGRRGPAGKSDAPPVVAVDSPPAMPSPANPTPVPETSVSLAPARVDASELATMDAAGVMRQIKALNGLESLRLAIAMRGERALAQLPQLMKPSAPRADAATLSDEFCAAFGVQVGERRELETALAVAQQSIRQAEVSLATSVLNESGTELSIVVPPFPETGGQIYDQLHGAFSRVLGAERFSLFQSGYTAAFDQLFNGMGTAERTVTVQLTPVKAVDGLNFYSLSDRSQWEGRNRQWGSTGTWATLREELGNLGMFLPEAEPVAAPPP